MMKRSHKQNCSLAFAADILSERWTMLVIRELLLKPCRYGELLNNLEGMGTNLLATRLKDMLTLELVEKKQSRYHLSELGRALEPSILSLIRWGLKLSMAKQNSEYLHRDEWDILAMKALFMELPADYGTLCLQLQISSEANQQPLVAWISIYQTEFHFGYGIAELPVDIHWNKSLALLSSASAAQHLDNSEESRSLNQFLTAFDTGNSIVKEGE
jgi:DNA-binding HxlR family transcriptional regulator